MRIDGTIHIGEGARWASRACSRLNGNGVLRLTACLLVGMLPVAVGFLLAWVVTDLAGGPEWLYLPVMLGTAFPLIFVVASLVRRRTVARYRRNLIHRGVSNPLPSSFTVTEDALVTSLGIVETRAPWSAVSEIFPVGPYWVLLIQGTANFLPKRNFGDAVQERAFIAEVLGRLSPDARGRSADAVRFAAG